MSKPAEREHLNMKNPLKAIKNRLMGDKDDSEDEAAAEEYEAKKLSMQESTYEDEHIVTIPLLELTEVRSSSSSEVSNLSSCSSIAEAEDQH